VQRNNNEKREREREIEKKSEKKSEGSSFRQPLLRRESCQLAQW
jgi:hypothetical protein